MAIKLGTTDVFLRPGGVAANAFLGDQPVSYGRLRVGLVAYWPLNETATSGDVTAEDKSGNGYDLTSNNSVLSAPGKIGNARDFVNANSEFLSVASNAEIQFGQRDWTVACWFNASVFTGQLVTKDADGQRELEFRTSIVGTNAVSVTVYHSGGSGASANIASLSTGVWYFAAVRYVASTNTGTLRVNATTRTITVPAGQTVNTGTAQFQVGARHFVAARDFFTGQIDEVARWNRALSNDELDTLYNSGNGINLGG